MQPLVTENVQERPTVKAEQLDIAFTPDPDDAFAWWAILTGRLQLPGFQFSARPMHIHDINRMCRREELPIGATSSAAWPTMHRNYRILSAGASVGRGYGPALVAHEKVASLKPGMRVGIPGNQTTGAMLLRLFYPGMDTVELPFDEIAAAVLRKELDAGVLIHEELLNWSHAGLHRVACLGAQWKEKTGLPIPVGLVVMHRRFGDACIRQFSALVRESLIVARNCCDEARKWAMQFSREAESGIADQFISMFANEDTLRLDLDCIRALNLLYELAFERGLIQERPEVCVL